MGITRNGAQLTGGANNIKCILTLLFVIMHPPRGPKGRGVAPIGCISIFELVIVTICTRSVYLAGNWCRQNRIQ